MMRTARRSLLLGAAVSLALPRAARAGQDYDVPYVPTPPEVVEAMLDMAGLQPGEHLVDLGSGDGRIPIAAARRGATALGVEIDPRLVTRARTLAQMAGQEERARFHRADLFTVRLRDADVVTLYLLPDVNARLRPKLLTELRPGARVVSHAFDMGDWAPDESRSVSEKNLYLWTIPAVAGGRWRLIRNDGSTAVLEIDQRYDHVSGTLDGRALDETALEGTRLRFVAAGVRYEATVGERTMDSASSANAWRAERID